ncbi:hypothetical protein [Ruegeria lacuscaerulensis]|nr:hypothetical protein [Ruegeria lacuscaerulensis]
MASNGALASIARFSFPIKQKKGAVERLRFAGMTVITFEGLAGFSRHIGTSGGKFRSFCIAEVLRALPTIRKIGAP